MNKEEKQEFDQLKESIAEIKHSTERIMIAVMGDANLGFKGLVKQQQEDGEFKKKILLQLSEFEEITNQRFESIEKWREQINGYFSLISNSKFWTVLFIVGVAIAGIWMAVKTHVWDHLKKIIP